MSFRRVVLWLVLLALAGGAYVLSTYVSEHEQQLKSQQDKVVALTDPQQVEMLELSGREVPKPIKIIRRPKAHRWDILSPVKATGDNLAIGRLVGTLVDARIAQRIPRPKDLAPYGLDNPRYRIAIIDTSGARHEVLIGSETPTYKYFYAMAPGGGEVWLLPIELRGALARSLFELRDKSALEFRVSEVKGLDFSWKGKHLVLKRLGDSSRPDWRFSDGAKADPDAVEDLLYAIHGLRVREFLDTGIDLKAMGLDKPAGRIAMSMTDGSTKGLVLGGQVKGRLEHYIRRLGGGPVMVVADTALKPLDEASRHSLSERHLMRFEREDALRLVVEVGPKRYEYEKREGKWVRLAPTRSEKDSDTQAGELLVWDLWNLKWEKVLSPGADYGFDKPRALITLVVKAPHNKGEVVSYKLVVGRRDPVSGYLAVKLDGKVYGVGVDLLNSIPGLKSRPGAKEKD